MRLTPLQIRNLSVALVSGLERQHLVRLVRPDEEAFSTLEKAITGDLQVEDRLNEEVEDILKAYGREIEAGRMDYKTMFDLVKKKLVRERGLVL